MSKRILRLYRGLPGSGKSFHANKAGGPVHEADQYFHDENGEYQFDATKLPLAHADCKDRTEEAMMFLKPEINVANTFTQKWEFSDYLTLADSHGYAVEVYHVEGNWGNVHGVPDAALKRMSDRWETYDKEITITNEKPND